MNLLSKCEITDMATMVADVLVNFKMALKVAAGRCSIRTLAASKWTHTLFCEKKKKGEVGTSTTSVGGHRQYIYIYIY